MGKPRRLFYFQPMSYTLFDDPAIRPNLMPFTLTRPVAAIRVGILTIAEKWAQYLNQDQYYDTAPYLTARYPKSPEPDILYINGAVCPTQELTETILHLENNQALFYDDLFIAGSQSSTARKIIYSGTLSIIRRPWDIFLENGNQIRNDFELIRQGRTSAPVNDPHTSVYNPEQVFIEPGAKIKAAILNAEGGPIYIGANTEIQEGSIIRGPFALCEGSTINMGGKMRGDTTIGPFSKVGGEISNSVLFGFSNKGHEGFIGNTVIGEWCNLGADTNTSNMKNNYSTVRLYNMSTGEYENTGLQFCGTMMGDHSKTSINSMLNTGTVIGVCSNVFGHGFPPKHIPSYAWGGAQGFEIFHMEKAFEIAEKAMARRNRVFTETDRAILSHIFEEFVNKGQ